MMNSRTGIQSPRAACPSSMAWTSTEGAKATAAMMTAKKTKLSEPLRPRGSISVSSSCTALAGSWE